MAETKKGKKDVYIRCPRCELNFCLKKDKYCSVCKAEMEGKKEEFSDDLELELCPICKINYIQPDEIMCASCLKERQENGGDIDNLEEEWDAYANREDNDDYTSDEEETGDMASISEIDDDCGNLIDDDLGFDLGDIGDDVSLGDDDDDDEDDDDDDDDFEDDGDDDFEEIDDTLDDDDDYDDDDAPKGKSKR